MPATPLPSDTPGASWLAWLAQASRALLDLVYPPRCASCGRFGALLCPACRAQIVLIQPPVCRRCGRPLAAAGLCAHCRRSSSSLDQVVATAVYGHPLREAIHLFKYRNISELAGPLAALMVEAWQRWRLAGDILVPVPLHPSRERERGYNQSALLARGLGAAIGLPVVTALLVRQRATPPQVTLDQAARRQNLVGAFACRENVAGQRAVVIDDVCTTGATLEACAVALKASGAARVVGFTLARAGFDPTAGAADHL